MRPRSSASTAGRTGSAGGGSAAPGLRERKKAKTRAAVQRHALRLIEEQGYDATTVDQIAEAAEISQSTFFRYFPTKEDVILYDPIDPLFVEGFRQAPPGLSVIDAIKAAMRYAIGALGEENASQWARSRVIVENAVLRARMMDEFTRSLDLAAEVIAERIGRPPDDARLRTALGAIMGVAVVTWLSDPIDIDEFLDRLDEALDFLAAGIPL